MTQTSATPSLCGRTHFQDPLFDGQLLRSLAKARSGCADLGECLSTALRIQEGDFESWYSQWHATALRVQGLAEGCARQGHRQSAGEAWLRAGEYHRQAEWFLRENLDDPRLLETADRVRACLRQGLEALGLPWRAVEIPFEGTAMPGYFFPARPGMRAPTMLTPTGYDSFAEEYYSFCRDALQRGYNVLVWDGPGQGQMLRRQGVCMRPDAEAQIGPAVEMALEQPETLPDGLVLRGISFAGYLAPRMASAEPRLAALVADTALYDLGKAALAMLPDPLRAAFQGGDWETVDAALQEAFAADPMRRFFFVSRMRVHGARTPSEYLRMLADYTLEGRAGQISCPTLVGRQSDDANRAQARLLYENLTCPKAFFELTAEEGAGDHGAEASPARLAQVVYDWLDETLARA